MPKNLKKTMSLSALEQDLLTLLNCRSLYGLEFVTAIETVSKGKRTISYGSLYPTLTRMEKKGLVMWRWGEENRGPRRKYYDITPYGKKILEDICEHRKALVDWAETVKTDAVVQTELTKEAPQDSLSAKT
jgi:PadR family transcriptional regulator PadR